MAGDAVLVAAVAADKSWVAGDEEPTVSSGVRNPWDLDHPEEGLGEGGAIVPGLASIAAIRPASYGLSVVKPDPVVD